jgi:hypothetical protein
MADTVNATVNQNGVNLDAAHVSLIFLGSTRIGVKGITYNFTRKSANTLALGAQPISYGYGQVEYTGGSLEFIADELESIINAAQTNDITAIPPFQIRVAWTPDSLNPNGKVEVLKNVRLTGRMMPIKGGDTHISNTVSFEYMGIEYN